MIGHLYALLPYSSPQPPAELDATQPDGGGSIRPRRRAVPGWAIPYLPTPAQVAAELEDQRAQSRAMRQRLQLQLLRSLRII